MIPRQNEPEPTSPGIKLEPSKAHIQPVLAVDNVFTALNEGQAEAAAAGFAEDAVVENWMRNKTYVGTAEIRPMLQAMLQEGRQFEIVRIEMAGDIITLD